ncbi:uncharacterized protein DSM5745_09454 [Aspergillus mulundensis]|uniref:Uncharacterized protein n=1 Tax=Aspergillus mulundensis TaxID=1810919 RepID=A0A3D8QVB6_9EURO|nr:hypothetical protein DSM5745_09454 [Aspergillus mulundensis]RDW65715.1 hypothetical protein DSM5745_09454 [Aspergillus mulundensis]
MALGPGQVADGGGPAVWNEIGDADDAGNAYTALVSLRRLRVVNPIRRREGRHIQAAQEEDAQHKELLRPLHMQAPHERNGYDEEHHVEESIERSVWDGESEAGDGANAAGGEHVEVRCGLSCAQEVVPQERGWRTDADKLNDDAGDVVADVQNEAEVEDPGHAEDAAVEEDDGELDEEDGVEEGDEAGEDDLASRLARKPAESLHHHLHDVGASSLFQNVTSQGRIPPVQPRPIEELRAARTSSSTSGEWLLPWRPRGLLLWFAGLANKEVDGLGSVGQDGLSHGSGGAGALFWLEYATRA